MYSLLAFQKSLGEAARGYRNVIGLEACSVGGRQLTFVESLCVSHCAREHITLFILSIFKIFSLGKAMVCCCGICLKAFPAQPGDALELLSNCVCVCVCGVCARVCMCV